MAATAPSRAMLAGESDIMELVEQYAKLMRGEAWHAAGQMFDQIRTAIATKAGADTARLDWLDKTAEHACVDVGFEMDGGVYLRLEAPGEEPLDVREKNSVRAAIDVAMATRA
jgi:hypothetical protein